MEAKKGIKLKTQKKNSRGSFEAVWNIHLEKNEAEDRELVYSLSLK